MRNDGRPSMNERYNKSKKIKNSYLEVHTVVRENVQLEAVDLVSQLAIRGHVALAESPRLEKRLQELAQVLLPQAGTRHTVDTQELVGNIAQRVCKACSSTP